MLGGMAGEGVVLSRASYRARRECRGTFFFRPEHEAALNRLCDRHERIEFEGYIDGVHQRMAATVTAVLPGTGMALFEGSGEPY
jgi:hypothetical protein